jgi:hypothetical protein
MAMPEAGGCDAGRLASVFVSWFSTRDLSRTCSVKLMAIFFPL